MKAAVFIRAAFVAAAFLCLGQSLPAQTLLIDFNASGTVTTSGPDNNPLGSTADAANWNVVHAVTALSSTALSFYADGTSASGITLYEGGDTSASVINWTKNVTANNLGGSLNTGNFASGSPAYGGIYGGSGFGAGVQIAGLAPGTYDIYAVGVNTNTSNPAAVTFYAGDTGSSVMTSTYTFTGLQSAGQTNGTGVPTGSWVEGSNYAVITHVTIANAGDILTIISSGNTAPINLLEITPSAVPEPSTVALLGAGALGLFLVVRRRAARA